MNNQTKTIIILSVALALVVGVLIGRGMGNRGMHGMHKMSDGTMMKNHDMQAMMHDMNASLRGKTGDAFDKTFLEEMIVHHQGAVDMAQEVLNVSKRPELIQLANEIISAQEKEISMMQGWLDTWFK
jgi:uncharacterized protein (DUF305 family)